MLLLKNIMRRRRIPVVTGLGVVSPVGVGMDAFWESLLKGRSGVDTISLFDAGTFPCGIAAEVRDFQPEKFLGPREVRLYSRSAQFCIAAYEMAMRDSGLHGKFDPFRTDAILGAGYIDFSAIENELLSNPGMLETYASVNPASMLQSVISLPASILALRSGAAGHVNTLVSACASGINSLNYAVERIIRNKSDVAITGGVDTPITRLILTAFCSTKVLATDYDLPQRAVLPFDARRTKSVLGEGAAIIIVEEMHRAIARGAKIYCELIPGSHSPENNNALFSPQKNGDAWAREIYKSIQGHTIDHINAHAPGDTVTDLAEMRALQRAMGGKLKNTTITSIKGATGGSMAGASCMQVATAAKTIETGIVPPVCNFSKADPEFADLEPNIIKKQARHKKVDTVLVNAHAVGGLNATILARRAS